MSDSAEKAQEKLAQGEPAQGEPAQDELTEDLPVEVPEASEDVFNDLDERYLTFFFSNMQKWAKERPSAAPVGLKMVAVWMMAMSVGRIDEAHSTAEMIAEHIHDGEDAQAFRQVLQVADETFASDS